MMLKYLLSIYLIWLFLPLVSLAADAPSDCKASNYFELIKCAEKTSSEIGISEQQLKSAQELEGVSRQWINPELDAETVSKGSKNSETTATLFFTLRLGGKRGALINEAQGEVERARANRDLGVSESRLGIMLGLYRLTHLKSEIHVEEESIQTFSKIINQYNKRPALSPEQDVSLSVFRMALADHQLGLNKLKSEEEKIYQMMVALTGIPKFIIAKSLPPRKQNWPTLETSIESEPSPQVRAALAELKLARSRKEVAQGDSWPDLRVGPSVKTTEDSGIKATYVGFGLSMPIPIFTQNGSGRAYRAQRLIEAEMGLDQTRKKVTAQKAELINRYNQTVLAVKNSLSLSSINQKHDKIERQFFKGLVPSSLIIEAHRQIFDLEEKRNSAELEALEALGQVLILDNKFNEAVL